MKATVVQKPTRSVPRILPNPLHRWLNNSYAVQSALQPVRGWLAPAYRSAPLIVYQMGKVGSEALEETLLHSSLQRPLYRVHAMREENIDAGLAAAGTNQREYFKRSKTDFNGLHLGRQISRDLHKHQWQVITMVRDPVAQNVSSFFQVLDLLVPDYHRRLERDDIGLDELLTRFVDLYPVDNPFVRWFDDELGAVFDVDVYSEPFPHAQGFGRFQRPQLDLLTIRIEDFNNVAVPALCDFLGLPELQLRRRNEAASKPYFELYQRFRREAPLPRSYVDGVYESQFAQHFYSEQERSAFRARLSVGP